MNPKIIELLSEEIPTHQLKTKRAKRQLARFSRVLAYSGNLERTAIRNLPNSRITSDMSCKKRTSSPTLWNLGGERRNINDSYKAIKQKIAVTFL